MIELFTRLVRALRRRPLPRALGSLGEQRAVWFYRLRGYGIVARNVRTAAGEIDIIARRRTTLVFVEVKTRQTADKGEPHEAVGAAKRLRIISLAERYLQTCRETPRTVRFDVVSLVWTGWRFRLTHYADAFRPTASAALPWRWE